MQSPVVLAVSQGLSGHQRPACWRPRARTLPSWQKGWWVALPGDAPGRLGRGLRGRSSTTVHTGSACPSNRGPRQPLSKATATSLAQPWQAPTACRPRARHGVVLQPAAGSCPLTPDAGTGSSPVGTPSMPRAPPVVMTTDVPPRSPPPSVPSPPEMAPTLLTGIGGSKIALGWEPPF